MTKFYSFIVPAALAISRIFIFLSYFLMFLEPFDSNKINWAQFLSGVIETITEKVPEEKTCEKSEASEESVKKEDLKDKSKDLIVPVKAAPLEKTPESAIRDPVIIQPPAKRRYRDIFV